MKFLKTTGILWVLVGLVVGYAYFYEYKGKNEKETQELESKKIIKVDFSALSKIQFKSSKGEISLEKVDGVWKVSSPYQDYADIGTIQNLYNALAAEKTEETIAEGEGIDKSLYGLTEPQWIELYENTKKVRVEIGTVNALSGKKYLVLNNENKVVLGSFTWDSILNKDLNEFRKKDLVEYTESQVESIQFSNLKTGKTLKIENKDGIWNLSEFKTNDLDRSVLESFVSSVFTLRAGQIDEASSSKKPLIAKFVLKLKDGAKLEEIRIFEAEGTLSRVEVSGRPIAFKISSGMLAAFNKSLDDFRDRRQPLKFDRQKVDYIHYVSHSGQLSIKKQGDKWVSLDNKTVDSAEVERLLNRLSQLKVKNFLGKDIPFQKSGVTQIKLKSGDLDLLDLQWSPRVVKDVFVAKSSIFDEYVGLPVQDIESLPTQAILKTESKDQPSSNKDAQ